MPEGPSETAQVASKTCRHTGLTPIRSPGDKPWLKAAEIDGELQAVHGSADWIDLQPYCKAMSKS